MGIKIGQQAKNHRKHGLINDSVQNLCTGVLQKNISLGTINYTLTRLDLTLSLAYSVDIPNLKIISVTFENTRKYLDMVTFIVHKEKKKTLQRYILPLKDESWTVTTTLCYNVWMNLACQVLGIQKTATHISQGSIESWFSRARDRLSAPSFLVSVGFVNGLRVVSLAANRARTDHVYIHFASITTSWPLPNEDIHST